MSFLLFLNPLVEANYNLVHLRQEVTRLKDQQLKQKRMEVLDKIRPHAPGNSTLLLSGKAFSKDKGSLQSTGFFLGVATIIVLALFAYQFVDPFSAVVVVAGFVGFGWFVLKPAEHEFKIFDTGIEFFGSFVPWEVIQQVNVVDSEGKIAGVSFNLINQVGQMQFWFDASMQHEIMSNLYKNL